MTDTPVKDKHEPPAVDLKDPVLAAFLAWLVPGLGHLYQRRLGKAALFFICIMSTFVYGLYLGGSAELGWGRAVYASWRKTDRRLPFLCQIGIGLPAMPALVQANRVRKDKPPLWNGFMAPPSMARGGFDKAGQPKSHGGFDESGQVTANKLYYDLNRLFEFGTVYTMIAGLLNILAIYDAWGGPVFIESEQKSDEEEPEESDEPNI